ncbi:MAG: phytanoyl-CoA dioxygenase family protein [Rhodospirillaceae bacterium]|nr:phytanoyl-CoA dioxygenase family protein [Rhodospirillaceae bacterium]
MTFIRPETASLSADQANRLSDSECRHFHADGFVIRRGFFPVDEIAPLIEACRADPEIDGAAWALADSNGQPQEVATWTELGNDILGVFPRVARMVEAAETVLGMKVYHWHSKLSMKRPGSSGSWDWHQDYGYWYDEGTLYPDFVTVTVALDKMDRANGCLKLVRGSHRCGRIDVKKVGSASGTDPERLKWVFERHETVECNMEPGDVVLFHSNTLHASGPNASDRPRTLIHCTYNAIDNAPLAPGQERHAFRPLEKLDDDALATRAYDSIFTTQNFVHKGADKGENAYGYRVLKQARRLGEGRAKIPTT